ncbi:MAG: hypothetical protein GY820_47225 [Gammaproteobacteria bacterium]|nr:hypothetical protein [Gammaproteobacteria bacterium]
MLKLRGFCDTGKRYEKLIQNTKDTRASRDATNEIYTIDTTLVKDVGENPS